MGLTARLLSAFLYVMDFVCAESRNICKHKHTGLSQSEPGLNFIPIPWTRSEKELVGRFFAESRCQTLTVTGPQALMKAL